MKAKHLLWMLIQTILFAGGIWVEFDMAREESRDPNLIRGAITGAIGAFAVTALCVDAIPRLIGWFRRMVLPPVTVARDVDPGPIGFPAIESDGREAGREGQSLAAPGRGGRNVAKLTSNRRIG